MRPGALAPLNLVRHRARIVFVVSSSAVAVLWALRSAAGGHGIRRRAAGYAAVLRRG